MKTRRTKNDRSGKQRQRKSRGSAAAANDATAGARDRTGARSQTGDGTDKSVPHSLSGDPDQRRDDDIQPSSRGPNTSGRGDSDVEGIHDHSTSVERE